MRWAKPSQIFHRKDLSRWTVDKGSRDNDNRTTNQLHHREELETLRLVARSLGQEWQQVGQGCKTPTGRKSNN